MLPTRLGGAPTTMLRCRGSARKWVGSEVECKGQEVSKSVRKQRCAGAAGPRRHTIGITSRDSAFGLTAAGVQTHNGTCGAVQLLRGQGVEADMHCTGCPGPGLTRNLLHDIPEGPLQRLRTEQILQSGLTHFLMSVAWVLSQPGYCFCCYW